MGTKKLKLAFNLIILSLTIINMIFVIVINFKTSRIEGRVKESELVLNNLDSIATKNNIFSKLNIHYINLNSSLLGRVSNPEEMNRQLFSFVSNSSKLTYRGMVESQQLCELIYKNQDLDLIVSFMVIENIGNNEARKIWIPGDINSDKYSELRFDILKSNEFLIIPIELRNEDAILYSYFNPEGMIYYNDSYDETRKELSFNQIDQVVFVQLEGYEIGDK